MNKNRDDLTIRKQRDFNRIYKRGKSQGSKYIVLIYMKNNSDVDKRAFVASKKVGNSVERNRARRLMRAAYREINGIKKGYDIIFVARKNINEKKMPDVKKSVLSAMKISNLIDDYRK